MASAWDVPAVGWSILVVGWLISPIITFFLPSIVSYLWFDASEKLEQLEIHILPELQERMQEVDKKRMLDRGNEKRISDVATLDKMAAKLRHAREDVEDIFDDHQEIELYRNRFILCWLVHALIGAAYFLRDWPYAMVGITNNKKNATALDFLLTAISRRNLKKRIENVESTVSEMKKSPLLGVASKIAPEDITNKNRSRIRAASTRKVFGREALRDTIMEKICEIPHVDAPSSSNSPCYSVIGIHGVSGSGKTTFARYIRDYLEDECMEKLFDTIMCIHLSETFSVGDIFHEMLKDITKDRHSNISDREELEEKLKESLRGKRFLLILDDLWVETKNDLQLEELISPLNVGLKGSKILVTARTKVAAGVLCADEPMQMPDMDEDPYFSMFMHYALGGTSVDDEEFKRVGRVIARKLHGSPIAAVIVAGQLGAHPDISFWKHTAELDKLNNTMDALWWSYQQLSPNIKRCFEYCNIFPRRFEMKKGDLIHLWIAQGFVKTSCATEDMEDVAEGYIQELVSYSFLQPAEHFLFDGEFFIIHDRLHDLADMVTGTDFFRIENESSQRGESWKGDFPRTENESSQRGESWKGDIPRDVRHLFVQNYDAELITKEIVGFGNLRTLIINFVGEDAQVEEKVINSICKKLSKLRVLAFAFQQAIVRHKKLSVPESVGQLKYLRYLSFRSWVHCGISLPRTLNKLQHIQLLDFGDGYILEFTFAELVNLRHLFCNKYVKVPYVGMLSSLQTLPVIFNVSNEQGYELKQLRDLNKLRGKLGIGGLENVKSKGQALQANLAAKKLTELTLGWRGCSPKVKADVLEGLCPPAGLKKLALSHFVGWRYPDWMVGKQTGGPKDLQELCLWYCSQPAHASGLAEAFPHLRVLKLYYSKWDALPGHMEHLTSLKELLMHGCYNIRSLPSLPQSLERFVLINGNKKFVKSCETVGHPNWEKIKDIPHKRISKF
ncbi:hypothetical protein ZWY2020_023350 [Hordeum vulgare]|nr:hypothetical protein ZWY2020_023350 [Hordeum vulgare]